jgi:agmatinase
MAILHAGISTFFQSPTVPPDREALREAGATVGVLGLPYDSTTVTRPGASHGPRAIRDASSHFSFGGGYHLDYDVTMTDHLTIADCGDVDGAPGRVEETCTRTERALDEIYAAGCFPVLLGGDHGTTIPGARAAARHVDGAMGFVMFDTHLDTAPEIDGEPLSHCCPAHRVLDLPNVDGRNMAIIGAHGAANPKLEKDVADENGMSVFTIRDIERDGIEAVARRALEVASDGTAGVYLSVDIDVLDGGFAWGTCGPEIGGMTGRELVRGLEIVASGPIVAFDCVEVAPHLDPSGNTARIGARVAIDMLAARAVRLRDTAADPHEAVATS